MRDKLRIAIYMRLSKADEVVLADDVSAVTEVGIADKSRIACKSGNGKNKPCKSDAIKEDNNSILGTIREDSSSTRDGINGDSNSIYGAIKEGSNSIRMQRAMLKSYVQRNFSEYQLLEFSDDGYSGTNFNRPGVTELLELVKESAVDCIVVKDFSRFSRDYIELGSYLDQIFPFMGVRFISINDGYDSKDSCGGIGEMDVSFRHLLYDLYSKDLSVKVKSSFSIRKEKGQYISANCPFGYEKAPYDKHMLVIEEDEAEIVRQIFSLTLSGYTSIEIAKKFNKEGVRTPVEFKIAKGKRKMIPKGDSFSWGSSSICAILKNEAYVGDMVYGKTEKELGGKNHLKPRSEWKIYHNHHEAIIDRETFAIVQERRGVAYEKKKKERHPLTGTLVCVCCGRNMIYRSGLNPYFTCPELYSNPKKNSLRKANAMFLEQYTLFEIQQKVQELEDMEKLRAGRLKTLEKVYENQKIELLSLKLQRRQVESDKVTLYEKYREGDGTDDSGLNVTKYQEKLESITKRQRELDDLMQKLEQQLAQTEDQMLKKSDIPELLAFYDAAELTKEIVQRFIEKIVVTDEQNIEIFWKEGAVI